jgi:Neocarzinostatin family
VTTRILAAAGLLLALGACSSSSRSPSSTTVVAQTSAAPTTGAPTTGAPTTAASQTEAPTTRAPTTTAGPAQTVRITPDTGLTDGQTVHVVGTGFTAGTTYSAVECADKGSATSPDDCDLRVAKVATADPTGKVTVDFPVQKGPFGGNKIVCSSSQKCLISVANAGAGSTTEVATEDITFAS